MHSSLISSEFKSRDLAVDHLFLRSRPAITSQQFLAYLAFVFIKGLISSITPRILFDALRNMFVLSAGKILCCNSDGSSSKMSCSPGAADGLHRVG